jgi:SAM-dependent methyltransferase
MGRWSRLLAPLLVDFTGVPDSGQVLDIGSGTGALTFEIAKRKGVHVAGIDPSKEFVDFATRKNPFPGRVRFEVADAQDLHFPDATLVASLSMLVFNFIPDPAKALGELRRVTKPGGRIAAAVWDYGDRMRMLRVFWDAVIESDAAAERIDEKRMPLCRAGELSQLWKQGGLDDVHEQPLDIDMHFDSFADYWAPFLWGQGPAGAYLQTVPADRLEQLRSVVKHRLKISSARHAFTLPARAWAVRGTVSS